jgi:zinc transport system substrate-binding protein
MFNYFKFIFIDAVKVIFLLFFLAAPFASFASEPTAHTVLVSVAPYQYFVERIGGDTVHVGVMVPAGASIHTYEPTPKEMMAASSADAWFLIGEAFETKAVQAFKNHHPNMKMIDLREGVQLISNDPDHAKHHHVCCHCLDLHIWLSPRQSKTQAKIIAATLIQLYPENRGLYEHNLKEFLVELDAMDQEIAKLLAPVNQRMILVSHPAYAYFCRDYQLQQISIEFEGKDPTPYQLTRLIHQAKQAQIKTVFIQPQYSNKGARLIADQLGAKVVSLDPYAKNYMESMMDIARKFSSQ